MLADWRVITERDDVAISVEEIRVHSTGLLVTFALRMPPGAPQLDSNVWRDWRRLLREEERDGPASGIVLGYRFGSGTWRSTINGEPADLPPDRAIAPISLVTAGNRERDGNATYWLWPVPETDVTFFARWEAQGLPFGTVTVSATQIAAARPNSAT